MKHLIFQEFRDLKHNLQEFKDTMVYLLYNQMKVAEVSGIKALNFFFIDELENIDFERSTYFKEDNELEEPEEDDEEEGITIITEDFFIDKSSDFTIYTEKSDMNLQVECYVSTEEQGEFFKLAEKVNEKYIGEEKGIEETFQIKTKPSERIRLKFVLSKLDEEKESYLNKLSVIHLL